MANPERRRRRAVGKGKHAADPAEQNPAREENVLRTAALAPRPSETKRAPVTGWAIFVAIVIVVAFLYIVRTILLPFVFAAAIAFVVTPAVDFIARRLRWLPRWASALILYVAVLILLGGAGYWVGRLIAADIAEISKTAPQIIQRLVSSVLGNNLDILGQHVDPKQISDEAMNAAKTFLMSGEALYFATMGITAVFGSFLCAVLVLYFLISGKRIVNGTLWLVPPEHRPEVAAMVKKVGPLLRRYLVGLCVVVLYTTAVAWIGFGAIFHIPHAPLLSAVVGLLELIPIVGPLSSACLVGIAAVQESSLWIAAGLAGFAIALRLSIDQFIGPIVLGKAASVHPVVIIFCFLSGAVVFGVIGLVLAVPVAATIRLVLLHYYAEPIEE
ncbi:MAG TPA: AI-2E family transporter [Stellaceae bacterium]|nr:AI-2E family transporter [Stellaceae bacterium]